MTVSIVIPAHNEEEAIERTLRGLLEHVKTPHEIIVVADHCSDSTEEIVQRVAAEHPQIRLLRNERSGSFGNALITGFEAATGDAIVAVMADLCDDPTTIDRMVQAMEERHVDIVCASRYMTGGKKIGGPIIQNILSRFVSLAMHIHTRIPTTDVANAYKMYKTEVLRSLDYDIPDCGTEYSMALLMRAYRKGFTMTDIPTTWTWREARPGIKQELRIFKRAKKYWRVMRGIV